MVVWVKRDTSTNCDPMLTLGLRSTYGTATVTQVISGNAWYPLKIYFSDMALSGNFAWSNITAFTLELLTTSSGRRPGQVWVDNWAGATLTNTTFHDQDWWPQGPLTWPWGDVVDNSGGTCTWSLVSDPASGLLTNSLKMSGTDRNTNSYVGGNGCALRSEDCNWSGVTNLAVTIRRAPGAAPDPLLSLELDDGAGRTATASIEATDTNYARLVVPYTSMTFSTGFSWTNVQTVKLSLLTTVAGSAPADLYIKRFELGNSADQPDRDWSKYDAVEMWVKRGPLGVDPVMTVGVVSPLGTSTVTRTVTNLAYGPLRVFRDEFTFPASFTWTNITALRLEMLSTVSNATPADLFIDQWRVVALALG